MREEKQVKDATEATICYLAAWKWSRIGIWKIFGYSKLPPFGIFLWICADQCIKLVNIIQSTKHQNSLYLTTNEKDHHG